MSQYDEKYNPEKKRHLVLVVDDELINREILGNILSQDYDVIYASDGNKALAAIRDNREILSLILLDLLMPGIHGLDLLKIIKNSKEMNFIPVIVMTADEASEVPSLRIGASDFITKPYPHPEIILARVKRTIDQSEDRKLIQSTERDTLTGLYNREYFFRYAEQFDQRNKRIPMDAILLNINHFHILNERHGKDYGNRILRRIADNIRSVLRSRGGFASRPEADTFLIYCRHGYEYQELLEQVTANLDADSSEADNRIRMRMGVYPVVDKTVDIERRFDRAKMAADTKRNTYEESISFYDNKLHEAIKFADRLLEDFQKSLALNHFQVYYQPKFDVRGDKPVLTSAEALVRWKHPQLGMISPAKFIPLLEENGLIQQLDHFVWQTAAAQIRQWKDRFGVTVPISINVSRIDMYDPDLINIFNELIEKYELTTSEYLLEITESAYTENSSQIIDTVNQLREMGFRIEMDDFGSGYSSLNMLSTLPIDALKLDMKFIHTAFSGRKDTRMIELIIEIAEYLSVPVIAEGVETEEQMQTLKALGCDIIQGYYFSRPVPSEEFEVFITGKQIEAGRPGGPVQKEEKASAETNVAQDKTEMAIQAATVSEKADGDSQNASGDASDGSGAKQDLQKPDYPRNASGKPDYFYGIARALAKEYYSIYYVNLDTHGFIELSSDDKYKELQMETNGIDFFETCQHNIPVAVYEEDVNKISYILNKDNMLQELEKHSVLSVSYRLILSGEPVYVNMKIIPMEEKRDGDRHVVVAVSNIDAQMKREQNFAEAQAAILKDSLTGVKSKFAFSKTEKEMNAAIRKNEISEFGIVICDVIAAGQEVDEHQIRSACELICDTFRHSPVYRVGNDEFAVLLRGRDYLHRKKITRLLLDRISRSKGVGGPVIANGLAEFDPKQDIDMKTVVERANVAMYENKLILKREQ